MLGAQWSFGMGKRRFPHQPAIHAILATSAA